MKFFYDFIITPQKTCSSPDIRKRLPVWGGVLGLLFISVADLYFLFLVNEVDGGNPGLWLIIDGLMELDFIQDLSYPHQWLLLYPLKILGDGALIFLSGWWACHFYQAKKENIVLWLSVYGYLALILDLIFILTLLPSIYLPSENTFLATHLLSYMIFGANILLFTNAYRCSFQLTYDQAFRSLFLFFIAFPMTILAFIFMVL